MGRVVTQFEGEETRMAKEKSDAEKQSKKVGPGIVAGTAIADLYTFLLDEKKHSLADAKKAMAKHKADKMGRIRTLARKGKISGQFSVTIDDEAETIQMKLGKAAEKAPEKEKEPEVASKSQQKRVAVQKAAKKPKKEEPEEEEPAFPVE